MMNRSFLFKKNHLRL